ncbi:K02A2.6-like, partial [Cordylochernes scorpioides]
MIRDQIIEKCNNKKLKEKLLQQENLTLSKTIDIARMLEISRKEIRLLEPQNDQTLNRVQNKPKKHYNADNFNKGRFTNQGTPSFSGASKPKCYRCGLDTHSAQECGAKKMTCSYCNKLGHLFRACRNRPNQNNNRNHKSFNQTKVKTIQEENKTEVGESSDEYTYYTGAENKEKVQIDGNEINMIIDTGSDRTFISYNKMLELYGHKIMPKLHDTTRTFFAYGQDRPLPCYGYFNAVISWKENSILEEIFVIDKKVESLLGGKASFELGIIKRVNHVNESMSTNIETLVQEHEHIFRGLVTIKGYSHKVTLKDNYRPIAQRCRRIPYAMVEAVNQELDKMLENGIIEEVHQGSEWVSNIIVVPKRDSEEIRLCIDLREVNKAILRERHPIPTIDNMLHALKGAKVFAKLDAKKKGFGSAPEAYQKGMDSILLDLKGVICYLDDVVVYAKDRQELEERLRKVLQRFDKVGIRLNRNKCKFAMDELDILGHIVSSEGIKPDNRKIEAVLNFPIPKNIEMLRWNWDLKTNKAFQDLKESLTKEPCLAYYNLNSPTELITDTSPIGLGPVLIQTQQNGIKRPIAYASRSLTDTEKKYSQIEKETLGCVWAIENFNTYIWGRTFVLKTDHKPLIYMLNPKNGAVLPPRIQRLSWRLQPYDFEIEFIQGKQNIADIFSRQPLSNTSDEKWLEDYVHKVLSITSEELQALSLKEIKVCTEQDPLFQKLKDMVQKGVWPYPLNEEFKCFYKFKDELSIFDNLILKGSRILLPSKLIKRVLRIAHETHQGMTRTKQLPASTNSPKSGSRAWLIRDTTCKMTSTMINTPLEKLNDQNYRSWKYNTKMMLIERELWKYVTEPAPDEEASRTIFNMKQEKALAMLALTISPSQQIHIMDCTTAREAWDTLEQVYEPKSRSRILQLKKQFISIRFEEQETMTNYLGRLKICSDHLREAGAEMQDQDLAYSMLAGLPESYDGIIMTFSNVEDKEFTSSKVKHVLLAEYERRMARRVNNTNEALQFGTTTRKEDKKKKNFTCYKCGKEGHIARSCRGKAKTPTPNFQPPRCSTHEIAGSEMLTALSCTIPDNSWVIDSCATHHVCNKREWFTNFQGITSDPILTASGTTRAEGRGDIKFKAYVGKHHVDLKLCNVLYVPNVRRNLLSVSSMENKGKIVNFANRRAQVFDSENRIVAIAHNENGLYVMKGRVILPNAELFNSQKSSQKQTLELWHQRFCHVNNDAIERMAKGELVKGLEISSMDRSLCDDCCVAKSTKEPHKPIRNIISKRPLELVHTDICGPMPVRSIGGSAYFLTFIDDYSRKITLFCLKHKNEVLKHFDSYLARAERETGHKLKVLRSDNGLEYCNHEFKTRLEQLGIKHELTNTYSPPMNGVAERANRVLLDITRSCLHSADLPQRFWAEAVNTAAYIRNKCYNSALGDKVPDELWSSRKPSVRHLKAFGCLAYSHIPTERRKKLDNRANRCILVGYSSQTKGYRLWCPETQHVIQTKHVKFDESKIGLKWTKVEDEPERYNHIWIEPDNQLEGDIDLIPEAERERNYDTSDQDLVGVNNDDIVQTRSKRIVRNPYGRAGKPKAELHFLDIIEPTTFEQAINSKEAPYWRRAMKDELRSLEDRNTWTLSDLPLGKRPISSRWVFKIKTNSKGDVERFKARLVARGFSQKRNVDFFETYSPVINFSVIRMIFALTINKNWYNRHLDVDNAYLYGELNEEIYMSPPDGSNDEKCEGKVLKLNRPIYGLRQSGLEWYCTLDKALEDIGFRRLAACNCLYTFEDKAVIAVYVDDLALFAESEDILTNIEEKIREKFKIKNLGPIKYFLGVEISYPDENTIILSQGKYTMSILERFNMMECRGVSTPLDNSIPITKKDCPTTDKEKDEIKHVPYRELIGSLLYLANSSRPDMTFAVTKLAQFCSNPGERHWQAAKHILRYFQATKNVSLIYKRGSDDILAFSDSDWANDIDDRRSTSGSPVTINGCLVSWRSKKQNCVSLSTMESEYIALAQTTKEILWIAQILENLKCLTNASRPITIFCDNRAAIEFSKNNIENNRSKHIDIRYHYIREKVNSGDIHVNYISTNDNLADIFTKGLKRTAHQNACAAMNYKNNLSIVKDKFNNYFPPKLNTTIERFKFNQMKQKEDESFNDFLTRIKLQIANCKYAVMSDELLKDRIVVGIINNEIRERLLSEADLNLEKATQICIACENATNQMKHVLSDSDKQVAVTKMNSKKWEDRKEPRKENTTNQSHKIIGNCRNCCRSHKINQCPAYQKRCNKCMKLNHFANLCRSQNTNSYKVRQIVGSPEPEMIQEFVIQSVENTNLTEDWYEEVKIKGKKINMKLDTGAQCNVLPLSLAGRLNLEIQRSPVKSLISFSGHRIPVEGQSLAICMVKNMTAYIRFIISRDNTCPILGRQTCSNLGLVKRVNTCQAITQEYQELFEGIGCLKGYEYEAKFQTSDMNMQVRPPRPIPLSIKERVKKELEEMEDNGIIKKVNYPTPISSQMVIAKQKGKIRICIDPSDINKVILRSHFPLRTFDQIAVNLHGSKYFTKLDLKKGYWQIKVAPNSQRYFTFSTPWGRYMFLRVPFGIKTAPEIFQKIMADLLQDLEGTENSMDDILIHAPDPQTLEIRTRAVLQRLKENGIKLNRDKCKLQLQEVQFLGHIVTSEGIKIDPEKVRAIGEIKSPSNKQELQRLLGMVQYLSRTAPTLKFFNPNGNLTLSVDASSYALGAVLLQNGKPIAYASSALNSTQHNYAQIEKEALDIKFGCDKFHQLIYGKTVDVETDHRPLETIFKKPLSKAPPRLQRIFLQIQQYDLRIKYKKGKELLTADLLSRDCSYEDTYLEENFEVLMTTPTNKSSYEELQALTKEDQELQELKNLILYGWPNYKSAVPESCKKYWPYRDELSTNEDLIFKGSRVFIPLRWKAKILKLIHEGHQGTNSCLRRARDSIYWHGMSQDIINTVENCRTCQANQRNKTKEPMIIKEIPSLPWEIVAADIFSIKGKNYLLITDNYSGFIDFKEMKTMNSAETIESLKKWFSVHGIPRLLETDNGPNFTSRDFKDFQKKWLFDHQTSSPLYPKSNGLAERAVQTAKNLIRKCLDSGQEVELALLNFYNTPRDGLPSPAQCLFSRRTRTLLPTSTHQLEPEIQKGHTQNLRNKREKQKTHHDKTAKTTRSFKEGEKIMLKQNHREWIPARVTQEVAPKSYKVQTPTGEYRRNSSFMRHTNLESPNHSERESRRSPSQLYRKDLARAVIRNRLKFLKNSILLQDHSQAKNPGVITRTRSTRTAPCPLQQGPGGSSSHPNDLKNEFLQRGRCNGSWHAYIVNYQMVETRSGKMQDPAQERIQAEESAKPQPGVTIGRDASSDPVVLNPNIDIPKYDGTEDPRPWIESLEEIGFLYHWADYIISRYAAMNMTGSAKTWLNLHKASFTSWENIKIRLIQDFSLDANKEELRMKLNRMQHWNEPAIRFAEDILVLCNKVDPVMEEETKIEHVIGGLKKEYSFALYLNPPKTTDDLLVVCKKMDSFEKKYRERVEKSRNLYNGPRYSRPQQQSRYVPPTAARNYQTTSRPQAPVSNNYKNDSHPTPRQYRNNFPQPSTPRRPYNPNFVPKPNLQRNTYNKSQEVSKNRTEDGRPICFKCNKPGHVARYCRVKFIRILEEDPADTQEKVEEKCQMNEISEKSGPRLYADIGTFEALVDTGADLSVVDLRTALDTGHGISKLAKICAGPDGKKLDMVGSIFLNIKIDDETLSHNFVILKTHLRTLILGRDFLKKMNAKIDCKQETIKYDLTNNHDEINFEMLKIKSAKDSIVPECSMKLIKALVETEDGEYIIEESSKMFQTNGLRLARSLINVINRETHIWITNPYPRPLKIMINQTLAFGSSPAKINVSREREVEKNEEPRFQINENLSPKEQKELKQVLERYGDLFSSRLGRTNLAKHRIDTEDAKPIKHKPYRVSAKERDIIKEQIDEMLTEGIIRPSSSPWSFPVILVKKRDGKYRFCVDYRKLNNVTVKDVYPIPRIDEVMDTLQGSTHFSAIDLRSGYWQVEVEERDKEKTAFTTAHGLYEFNVMPFGLCNAPATFERNMENMLGNLRWQICLCYLDDVIIYSPDFPTHLKRLEAVFRCFRESNLRLNDKKCRFAFEELEILGYITSKHGIKPAEHNIKAVRNFPRPKKVKEVQSFLGMCSYYRKFIKDFSKIADPLTNLIKKSVSFTWTERQEEAFQTLKTALLSPPILGHFNPNAPTYVHTDASNIGIGATLVQDIGGEEKVISYLSRTLSKAEQNYSTTEKECLAVVWSMSKLRPYLYGRHFKIVTDHHALCWLKNLKDPTGRLARWALKIQEYDFDIIHKSGKKHLDADGLSRGPLPETDWDEDFERLFLNQITDEEDKFIESVKKNLNGSRRSIAQNFKEEDGCLFKKNPNPEGRAWLLVVPENKKREIMKEYHNHMSNGHLGVARTMYRIKSKYFWPSMLKDVSEFVRTCHLCQSRKGSNQLPSGLLQPIPPANFPFERIGIDFVGPLPSTKNRKKWIIVLSDYYTRYAETRAVSEATVKEVSKFLVEDIFLRHGAPQYLISDRGSQFTSNLMKEVMKTCKIKHCFTTSYHPQTNGLTERLNRTLINMLSMYVNTDQKNWDEILPFITHAYNTTIQETTGYSPFFLMFGREPTSLLDDRNISVDIDKDDYDEYIKHHLEKINRTRKLVINNTIKTQERMKKNYDKKHMERSYEPGELVAVWTPIRKIGKNQPLINDQPLQIVPLPSKPWMKLGIDIVGPIGHHYVLTVIDYYSSYPEAMIIEDISSKTIIEKLMEIFARHGYPHEVVTDNGLQFVSTSMERFLKECGIRHIKASPYYPKSNGKMERFHRFLKKQFNSSSEEGKDWKEDLSRILISRVNDAEEDESNIKEFNMVYKEKMKTYNDIIRKASPHNFEIGNLVYVANPNNGKLDSNFRSEHHVILENTSINSFKLVNTKNGKIIHRNAKHLKHVSTQETNQGISDLIPEESQENLSSDSTRIEHLNSSDVQIPDDNSSNQDKDTSLNRPSSSRTGSTFNPVVSDRLDAEALHQLPPE